MDIVTQAIGLIASAIGITSLCSTNKKWVLVGGIISSLVFAVHFYFLNAHYAIFFQLLIPARNFLFLCLHQYRTVTYYTLQCISLLLMYAYHTEIPALLFGTTLLYGTYVTFFKEHAAFRKWLMGQDVLFLISNAVLFSIGGFFSSLACLLLNARAVYKLQQSPRLG
jgi:hypothetical protein